MSTILPYDERVKKTRRLMKDKGVDFLFFFDDVNQYYISGAAQNGILVLPVEKAPIYLVRRNLDEAKRDSWIQDVRQLGAFEKSMRSIGNELGIEGCVVGIEYNLTSVTVFKRLQQVFKNVSFSDCSSIILEARKIKGPDEIDCLRKAVRLTDLIFEKVPSIFYEGITEVDFAAEINCLLKKQGSEGIAIFYDFGGRTIIWKPGFTRLISGIESGIPSDYPIVGGTGLSKSASHGPSHKKIVWGEQVTIDLSAIIDGYHADVNRTFFVGEPSTKLKDMYNAALEIQTTLIENAKPGERISDAVGKAIDVAKKKGYLENLMGPPGLNHETIGHGVGLFANEFPLLTRRNHEIFEQGVAFAVEPKVVVHDVGSVEVEDTVIITQQGNEVLSQTSRTIGDLIL